MPYRLRVTEEEVRQELAKMGFTGLPEDSVAALRKDLLKMIKSDLRKLNQEKQDMRQTDISNPHHPATVKQDTRHKPSVSRTFKPSIPTPKKIHSKETSYSSFSTSNTSQDEDGDTGESGYSDVESTMSGLSEATSSSSVAEVPRRQTRSGITRRKPKEIATKERVRGKSKEAVSGTHKEPGGVSRVDAIAPDKKTIRKTRAQQVAQKGLPQYPSRPDPVRLYHYYKAHWDKHKVPGEDPRLKLRWDVRSKLFYGE